MDMQTSRLNIYEHNFIARAMETWAQLRQDSPIQSVDTPDGRAMWLVTRYQDAVAVLKDPRFVKSWRSTLTPEELAELEPMPLAMQVISRNMLSLDPPDHTRLRGIVSKAFTPRLVEQLRPRIQQITDELIDAVASKGAMNLIDDFAFPLPITVIAEMLGVPLEDQDKFRAWSNTVVGLQEAEEGFEAYVNELMPFVTYLQDMFVQRRNRPADDLVTALIQAEEAGDRLDEFELYAMVFLLLVAGHETTVNLIGNGMLALMQHRDQLELLQQRPELLPSAVEELLRYTGPVETSTMRFAREDVSMDGVTMKRSQQVLVVLASADRDERQFTAADKLDVTRANTQHLAFGNGIHYCLGAPLARLEAQVAIGTLVRRLPNIRLAVPPGELAWRPSLLIRGLQKLPVLF
jgi:cytochrome P450 PksS